ncbi:MAG: HslU--HslV peptidase ATPase subunit, partial [Campylobacterales bacterium]
LKVEISVSKKSLDFNDSNVPPEIVKVQESLGNIFAGLNKENTKKEVTVKEAKDILKVEASENVLDSEAIKIEALKRAEQGGIVFIDEMDKIAVSSSSSNRQDPSKEGVQRDLLPIVEGSSVSTKHGQVKTDHILFISAGAFHISKPSDLIPELQGRFPLRVELSSLSEDALYQILTQTKNSLLFQYKALLGVEGVELKFDDDAIKSIARYSQMANEKTEDIGARRLHTVVERILEDISFDADTKSGESIVITKELVEEKLSDLIEDVDSARYIL